MTLLLVIPGVRHMTFLRGHVIPQPQHLPVNPAPLCFFFIFSILSCTDSGMQNKGLLGRSFQLITLY